MIWINRLFFLVMVTGTASCATTRNYDDMLGSWVGQEMDTLVSEWGPPSARHAFGDGNMTLEYVSKDGIHNPDHVPGRGLTGLKIGCKTIFIINNSDVITGWRRDGYDCRWK